MKSRFQKLCQAKDALQKSKEDMLRNMSDEDWDEADRRLKIAADEGRLPPKISSYRKYKGPSFDL